VKKSRLKSNCRILEGIMTTVSPKGGCNIAPMGPIVDVKLRKFMLRPFKTSMTFKNLKARGEGVFHVVDDVLLIARAAISLVDVKNELVREYVRPAGNVTGVVLANACRYYELEVESFEEKDDRSRIVMRVVDHKRIRDFFGFNRAMHAVIEASILATRVFLTGPQEVLDEYKKLQVIVDKTGSEREHQAMDELRHYVQTKLDQEV